MADSNFDKVSVLLPMHGANNGITFKDYSGNCNPIFAGGNAKTSTSAYNFTIRAGTSMARAIICAFPTSLICRLDRRFHD